MACCSGRVNVAEYNRGVAEDLEIEDIVTRELDEVRREALLASKRADQKIGAVCGAIMILAQSWGWRIVRARVPDARPELV